MGDLDPMYAARWALIAIALIMIGALLTTGVVTIEQRAVVLSGIIVVLASVAFRRRRNGD